MMEGGRMTNADFGWSEKQSLLAKYRHRSDDRWWAHHRLCLDWRPIQQSGERLAFPSGIVNSVLPPSFLEYCCLQKLFEYALGELGTDVRGTVPRLW